jgi:hypothetical protein
VQRFFFEKDKEYPDGAAVEFWSSGRGTIRAWGKDIAMKEDPRETPYLIECELLSPYAKLQPGESYQWHYEWYAANIGGQYPVVDCNQDGVISKPLTAKVEKDRVKLTGRFGVFQPGQLQVVFLDNKGRLKSGKTKRAVLPLKAVVLNVEEKLPAQSEQAALLLLNEHGEVIGELARVKIRK